MVELANLTATTVVNWTRIGAYTGFTVRGQKQSARAGACFLVIVQNEALWTFAYEAGKTKNCKKAKNIYSNFKPLFDVLANMRAWRVEFTFIDIFTCCWIIVQLHSLGAWTIEAVCEVKKEKSSSEISIQESIWLFSFCYLPTSKVCAMMSAWWIEALVFVDTTRTVDRQLISRTTLAVKWTDCVHTMSFNAWGVETLVNVVTVEFVMSQNEAVRTSTLVSSFGVHADMRAIVQIPTLVHILTSEIVRA